MFDEYSLFIHITIEYLFIHMMIAINHEYLNKQELYNMENFDLFVYSLNIQWIIMPNFHVYSRLNIHWIFNEYSINNTCIFKKYINIWIWNEYSMIIQIFNEWIFNEYSLNISIFIAYSLIIYEYLNIQWIFIEYTLKMKNV